MDCARTNRETHDTKHTIFSLSRVEAPLVSDHSKDELAETNGRWTIEEHLKFIEGNKIAKTML